MVNFVKLQEVRKQFSSKDITMLTALIDKMHSEKPYAGLHIVYNVHITLASIVQIEALLASGANVTVTVADHLRCDPEAMSLLKEAGVAILPYATIQNEHCDITLDCCAGLLDRVHPTYGAVELTQTGVVKFKNSNINYPVISVDDSEIKKIETLFGTGDGFVRGFRKLTRSGLHHKKFVLFGYGKVGKGIVRSLEALTNEIIIIESEVSKVKEAQSAGFTSYLISDKEGFQHLKSAYCIVTATGIKDMMSHYFERDQVEAKYLVNMGSEDEYGDQYTSGEVLNEKLAINFCLEQPTRILLLDPIFYAQNTAIDILLKKKLSAGVYPYPKDLDLEILSSWISNHYHISLEGDYLKGIIEHIPFFVYWKDCDSVYQGCNEQFAHAAGFSSPDEVIGKTDYELPWGHTEAELYRKGDIDAFSGKSILDFEETQKQANGQKVNVLASKVPYYDSEGHIIGVLGVYADITARKKMEKALQIAKENAETADKAKTEFLENMRHDIRTPLTGIVGFANIIAEEVKSSKIKEYVDNLTASSYALLDLLNEILEVIRINSKEVPLLKKKFDFQKRLSEVIKLNQSKAQHKNIDLLFDYDPNIPQYVIGDSTRIHRIALELIANALNFTDKGFVKLTTKLAKKNERELIIKIIIEDTGMGIAKDKQQEVFIQFKRLTPSYEGIYKGAGLGLAIVKQFIDELDGEIYIDSQVGKGSKFTCVLPLKASLLEEELGSEKIVSIVLPKKQEIIAQTTVSFANESKEIDTTRSHILLVEDQVLAATAVKSILDSLNCQVDIAQDGRTAVELAQKNNYDLIFMDIGLPDIDGYEVTKRIRLFELSQEAHVPIIALTAHVDEENKQNCLDVGMNAVISKPLNKEKASDILNAFIPYREKPKAKKKIETKLKPKEKADYPKLQGKVIDFELAEQLLGDKKEVVKEMLEILVNSSVEELEKLRVTREKEDWSSIAAIAHKIKGGASYCGTARLQEACSQMEDSVKKVRKELFADLYKQLLSEIEAVKEAVKTL